MAELELVRVGRSLVVKPSNKDREWKAQYEADYNESAEHVTDGYF
jgi:virulence-associated protein VagC